MTLLLPHGLVGSVWGASIAHNDIGTLNMSGLSVELASMLDSHVLSGEMYPATIGDGIFLFLISS